MQSNAKRDFLLFFDWKRAGLRANKLILKIAIRVVFLFDFSGRVWYKKSMKHFGPYIQNNACCILEFFSGDLCLR